MMRLALALSSLSRRERWLLALLAVVALPAAIWLALADPLLHRRAEARAALLQAEDTRAWLVLRWAELSELPPPPPPGPEPEGLGGLEARLVALNLPRGAGQLADAGGGAVTLRLASVPFGDLMTWLEGVQVQSGYRLAAITVTPGAGPSLVTADLRLEPGP